MAYTLHLKMLGRPNLPTQDFSSVGMAIEAAVNIKATCTDEERKGLLMSVSDADGNLLVKNAEIESAYTESLGASASA